MNLGVALRPNPVIDLGPIDLTPGTIKRASFQPGYPETYAIGIRMNQRTAERLYPCMVSVDAMQGPECKRSAVSWPVALVLKLSSEGHNIARDISPTTSLGGGQYDGAGNYTWPAARIRLTPDRTYHLEVRSTGRTSSLASAQPHLVVSAASAPGLLESKAIEQAAALFVGLLLVASAAIWAVSSSRRRRLAAA